MMKLPYRRTDDEDSLRRNDDESSHLRRQTDDDDAPFVVRIMKRITADLFHLFRHPRASMPP